MTSWIINDSNNFGFGNSSTNPQVIKHNRKFQTFCSSVEQVTKSLI